MGGEWNQTYKGLFELEVWEKLFVQVPNQTAEPDTSMVFKTGLFVAKLDYYTDNILLLRLLVVKCHLFFNIPIGELEVLVVEKIVEESEDHSGV